MYYRGGELYCDCVLVDAEDTWIKIEDYQKGKLKRYTSKFSKQNFGYIDHYHKAF